MDFVVDARAICFASVHILGKYILFFFNILCTILRGVTVLPAIMTGNMIHGPIYVLRHILRYHVQYCLFKTPFVIVIDELLSLLHCLYTTFLWLFQSLSFLFLNIPYIFSFLKCALLFSMFSIHFYYNDCNHEYNKIEEKKMQLLDDVCIRLSGCKKKM